MKDFVALARKGIMLSVLLLAPDVIIAADAPLFSYKGKSYSGGDLDPASRQALFDGEKERYDGINRILEDALLMDHVREEAVKKKVSEQDIKTQLFSVKEPDEKAMTAWYEKNKDKIPYPYDKVKTEISRLLQAEEQNKKRTSIVEELKRKGNFKSLVVAPVAPAFQIATQGFPMKGNKDAKVTIVEFADFQCPHCKHASEMVKSILKKYGDKVKLVFLDFPINPSGISRKVAEGAVCADQQGKYWEFHGLAFDKQATLTTNSPGEIAKELKLDMAKFDACLASAESKAKVAKGEEEGRKVGVQGTPAFYINGRRMQGGDEAALSLEIDNALKG